eukprot:2699687-Pyramimonas_sp.AAC.1
MFKFPKARLRVFQAGSPEGVNERMMQAVWPYGYGCPPDPLLTPSGRIWLRAPSAWSTRRVSIDVLRCRGGFYIYILYRCLRDLCPPLHRAEGCGMSSGGVGWGERGVGGGQGTKYGIRGR